MAEDLTSSGAQSPTEDEDQVDSLAQGRGKRSTAGRHMSALLDAEADDDLALLFQEIDEDNEFSTAAEDDGDDDMRMDSSSEDDEDQGPSAKENEDEGEKELQREVRAERRKRRAQDDLRLKAIRKKVKIDPTAVSTAPPPRPKKKSERISWLPTPEEGPIRSSSRRQTMQNKELTHARLKDSEEKRVRLIATMEEAAKRKAHLKPKERTQADWLAEAARVERMNSKSLNRWEETEKRKADERRAKIEALHSRRLEGPMISFWSGIATWVGGRLTRVGRAEVKHRPKPEKEEPTKRRSKKMEREDKVVEDEKPVEIIPDPGPPQLSMPGSGPQEPAQPGPGEALKQSQGHPDSRQVKTISGGKSDELAGGNLSLRPESQTAPAPMETSSAVPIEQPAPAGNGAPETRIPDSLRKPAEREAANHDKDQRVEEPSKKDGNVAVVMTTKPPPTTTDTDTQQKPSALAEASTREPADHPISAPEDKLDSAQAAPESPGIPKPTPDAAKAVNGPPIAVPVQATQPDDYPDTTKWGISTPVQEGANPSSHPSQLTPANGIAVPRRHPDVEHTSRNATILENFDEETAQSREYSIYFNAKKPSRLTSKWTDHFPFYRMVTHSPQRYRHRYVSSRRFPHGIATPRRICHTQTHMHIARSSGPRLNSIRGVQC